MTIAVHAKAQEQQDHLVNLHNNFAVKVRTNQQLGLLHNSNTEIGLAERFIRPYKSSCLTADLSNEFFVGNHT